MLDLRIIAFDLILIISADAAISSDTHFPQNICTQFWRMSVPGFNNFNISHMQPSISDILPSYYSVTISHK